MLSAEQLLKRNGFHILGKKEKGSVVVNVDGKDHLGTLEADFTVGKEKKRYVVVVKYGEAKIDPTDPAWRRKLIEYDRVFGLDEILLVDPEEGGISKVLFKFPREKGLDFYVQFLAALFIIALVVGIIWLLVAVKLF